MQQSSQNPKGCSAFTLAMAALIAMPIAILVFFLCIGSSFLFTNGQPNTMLIGFVLFFLLTPILAVLYKGVPGYLTLMAYLNRRRKRY